MIWIYIAAAIFGGGFVIPALIGSLDFDTDADFDFDTEADFDLDDDADVDLDVDPDSGGVDATGAVSDWVSSLLTFRTLIFFATFFGAVGIVLTWLDYSEPVPLASAAGLGLVAGTANARLMAYLKRSDVSSHLTQRELSGSTARVVLPIGQARKGRVEIDVGGQPTFMVALPYRADGEQMPPGSRVVVVEVKDGTALVAPLPDFDGGGPG
jgi:membrane protein implicated in regulation of membrane protease activity